MEIYGPYIIGSSISSIIGGISYYLFSDNSQETNVLQEIDNTDKIIKETKKGDAYIINFITKLFKNEGFKIISQTKFNNEIVF